MTNAKVMQNHGPECLVVSSNFVYHNECQENIFLHPFEKDESRVRFHYINGRLPVYAGIVENSQMPSASTEYLTTEEAASILSVSPETITRKFEHRKGVVDLGRPEDKRRRRYRLLRIPRETFDTFITECLVN